MKWFPGFSISSENCFLYSNILNIFFDVQTKVMNFIAISNFTLFFFAKCLQNQVLIIYNIFQKCPKQTAFQLKLTPFQPLLHCSLLPVWVLSKSIVAFLVTHRGTSDITNLSLRSDEAMFFANSFSNFINSGSLSASSLNLSKTCEELLYSLKCLTSLPCSKACFAVPNMLDIVLALCLHDNTTIAKLALEVLWNISVEPTVALAILCHENLIGTLKRMSVFNRGHANLTRNILWILGYGNVTGEWISD